MTSPTRSGAYRVVRLGTLPYQDAWALQKELSAARGRDAIPDTLLLVEHPHVYTLGSAGDEANLIWSEAERRANGVTVLRVDRGGDVTYHGPGQLVGYPILKLPRGADGLHADVVGYVRRLERVVSQALAEFGIAGFSVPGLTGVWVNSADAPDSSGQAAKIAAIGVRVTSKAVTMHGFALNINPDMRYFGGIIPCGLVDKPVTSMSQELGSIQDFAAVSEAVVRAFAEVMVTGDGEG